MGAGWMLVWAVVAVAEPARRADRPSPTPEQYCRYARYRVQLVVGDSTLTRDELDDMLEPHRARIATCQPQTACWGRYGVAGYDLKAYEPMKVLVQLPRSPNACRDTATTLLHDPSFDGVLQEVQRVRPDANCTCYSIFELTAVNNHRIPGSPQLPPPKEKKPKRGQGTTEKDK